MITSPLNGRVALVTGAARNLGRAYALGLAQDGARVVVHFNADSSRADAEATLATIVENGGEGLVFQADLTVAAEVDSLFEAATKAFGGVDILVNNAGMVLKKPMVDVSETEFDRIFAVNTKSVFLTLRAAARQIRDGGRIINLGTTLLAATTGYYGVYAGSKAPLEDFTRALATELGSRGITVNTVAPGPIDTSFFHSAETPESVAHLSRERHRGARNHRADRTDDPVPRLSRGAVDHRSDDLRQRRVRGPLMATDLGALFVSIVNGGDTESFLDLFAPSGFVDDWGRVFRDRDAIRRWSDDEFIGAHGRLTDVQLTSTDAAVTVVALWTSSHYTGPSRFTLHLAGDRLGSMAITAA